MNSGNLLLKVNFFGPMQIWRNGVAIMQFKTRTERALFIYLLLHTGQPLSRRLVATILWPESSESAALKSLRVILTRLRKTLNEQTSETPFIIANRTQMWFNPALDYLFDVAEFETAVANLQALPTSEQLDHPEAIEWARQAMQQYAGELLRGFDSGSEEFDEWVLSRRRELHRQAVWVGSLTVRQAEKRDEYVLMEQWARQLLVLEPWHEEAHQWVMYALQAQGQRQAALTHYKDLVQMLNEELGVAPGHKLQAFHLWLTVGEMDAEHNESKHPRGMAKKGNLPSELTPYFGREDEGKQLVHFLASANHRLVTLTGQGGLGKTRMAIAVARQLQTKFTDGVWLVELAGQKDALNAVKCGDIVARAIAAAMKLRLNSRTQIADQVVEWLRNSHCLILLDNIDDLLDAADFILVLLHNAPQVRIMTTSREPLDCVAETTLHLEGLSVPAIAATADSWEDYAASKLFVDRAQRMVSSFAVTTENWPLIVQLCQQVAGTPLALELAASVLRSLSLEALVTELSHSIHVLTTNRRDLPSRHRTMRATLDESWRVLSAEERIVLAKLSVFRQSFSTHAAHVVAQATAVVLDMLVSKSLLRRQANGRLAMHPLVWRYAAERLTEKQVHQVGEQHANFFFDQLTDCCPGLFKAQPIKTAQRLELDIANIHQAWLWFAKHGSVHEWQDLLDATIRLYHLLGRLDIFEQMLMGIQTVLASASSAHSIQLQARVWIEQARLNQRRGELVQASNIVEQVLHQIEADSDAATYARAYLLRGDIRQKDGYPLAAKADFEKALALAEQCDDVEVLVDCLSRLTYFIAQTTRHNERAVHLARDAGDHWLEMRALQMLGISEANAGRYEQAYQCFAELLYLNAWLSVDHLRKINIFSNLGRVMRTLGDYERALAQYERSLILATKLHDDSSHAFALMGVSYVCRMLGRFERALTTAVAAEQLILDRGGKADKVSVLLAVGHAHLAMGGYDQALSRFAVALDIAENLSLKMFSVLCRAGLIEVHLASGKTETAVVHADLIWHYLQANSLNLTLEPFYIYWQTIRVFDALADPRLNGLLQRAHDQLQNIAQQIEDPYLQHLYLTHITVNKQLVTLWTQRLASQNIDVKTDSELFADNQAQKALLLNGNGRFSSSIQKFYFQQSSPAATISDVKRAKFTQYFNMTDKTGSGLITQTDFLLATKRICQALGFAAYSPQAQQLQAAYVRYWEALATADRDHDGAISLDEWIEHFYEIGQDPTRITALIHTRGEMIVKLFAQAKPNQVSRTEWAAFFQAAGYPSEEYKIAFNKLDQDKDGLLSLQELKKAGTQFFSSDDLDAAGNWLYGDFTKHLTK